jgi:hypothetical protein
MADDLTVDPKQMRTSASGIHSSASDLKSKVAALQQKLAGHGEPWGNDDVGSIIGMLYQGASELVFDCYDDNIGGLEDHAEGVHAMAAEYFGAEDASDVEVNKVRDVLG